MKKEFEKAEVEVIEFDKEDVIATSPTNTNTVTGTGESGTGSPFDDNGF